MNMTIRLAKPGDESGIHEAHMRSIREVCVTDHGPDEIKGWGNRPLGDRWVKTLQSEMVWVVEKDSVISGYAYIGIYQELSPATGYIHGLYLTPEVLGQGIGRKLMQLMLDYAKDSAVEIVTLESTITAHEFYKSFGFKDSGPAQKIDICGHPVTNFSMILRMNEAAEEKL